jgi:hypothetical protein
MCIFDMEMVFKEQLVLILLCINSLACGFSPIENWMVNFILTLVRNIFKQVGPELWDYCTFGSIWWWLRQWMVWVKVSWKPVQKLSTTFLGLNISAENGADFFRNLVEWLCCEWHEKSFPLYVWSCYDLYTTVPIYRDEDKNKYTCHGMFTPQTKENAAWVGIVNRESWTNYTNFKPAGMLMKTWEMSCIGQPRQSFCLFSAGERD